MTVMPCTSPQLSKADRVLPVAWLAARWLPGSVHFSSVKYGVSALPGVACAVQLSLSTKLFALSCGARRGWGRRFSAIRLRRLFRVRALLFNAGFECP